VIVNRLSLEAKKGASCTLITNDIELRTRVRQHLEDSGASNWNVAGLEEFREGCDAYTKSQNIHSETHAGFFWNRPPQRLILEVRWDSYWLK
jgi:hypothetical protein